MPTSDAFPLFFLGLLATRAFLVCAEPLERYGGTSADGLQLVVPSDVAMQARYDAYTSTPPPRGRFCRNTAFFVKRAAEIQDELKGLIEDVDVGADGILATGPQPVLARIVQNCMLERETRVVSPNHFELQLPLYQHVKAQLQLHRTCLRKMREVRRIYRCLGLRKEAGANDRRMDAMTFKLRGTVAQYTRFISLIDGCASGTTRAEGASTERLAIREPGAPADTRPARGRELLSDAAATFLLLAGAYVMERMLAAVASRVLRRQ